MEVREQELTDDAIIDARIGMLLKIGTLTSASVILCGGIFFLFQQGSSKTDFHAFRGQPDYLTTVGGTISAAFRGNPAAIIQFGLLLLIATPVARVIFAVFAFALQKDFLYVTISTIVLLTLLYSLIWH
jgi:uncharacterized membrane protein